MKLPSELTTVTSLSKAIALLMFISLPILAFIFGMNYYKSLESKTNNSVVKVGCTEDAKICPDGSTVGRSGSNCEFEICPTIIPEGEKINCSGIRGLICPEGYVCDMGGKIFPDASGICVKVTQSESDYTCPETENIDCIPTEKFMMKRECTRGYLQWALENCPDFKGAAY